MPDPVQPDPDEAERLLKEMEVQIMAQRARNEVLGRRRNSFRALAIVVVVLGLLAVFAMLQFAREAVRKPAAGAIAP